MCPSDGYNEKKRAIGEDYQQPIYQEPADGYVHERALKAENLMGSGTYRIGERNMWPTQVEDSEPEGSGALDAFWK